MRDLFYGWYLKCQSETNTLAVIPAFHQSGQKRCCSIQVITNEAAWRVFYPEHYFYHMGSKMMIGKNSFGKRGMKLNIHKPDLCLEGELAFGALTPPGYDVMGPLAYVPLLECRHMVWSMNHLVWGRVRINQKEYFFHRARGYWEGDRGTSFPKEYLWTQCSFPAGSVMLSMADVPVAGIHLTGVLAVIWRQGKEYRLATYLGARVEAVGKHYIRVTQGDMELEVCLKEGKGKSLDAPVRGKMERKIQESIEGRAFYRFRKGGSVLFAFETSRASFEYEYV
ncbi:MAG: hypothetical protein IJP31_01350 [Lachnospiraceae bacterium]|nr:hypothetical protein [Lachnospiraceae bacterium]